MGLFLGIDTSNYTTSAALYNTEKNTVRQEKKLLHVAQGGRGLRQSEALFQHVQQLPELMERLLDDPIQPVNAIGVSDRPRQAEGSYMPCFLAGVEAARCAAAVSGYPVSFFSHQEGHIAAALYATNHLSWIQSRFLAFHVSGGTTEALLVEPDDGSLFSIHIAARSTDLKAGQAIDRIGVLLGLSFPCGVQLERLASQSNRSFRIHPSMKGADCSLSGIENQCRRMLDNGEQAPDIAKFCLDSICASVDAMTGALVGQYGNLPLLFAGGVMSNGMIRRTLTEKYGASFADPQYAADNAAGIAVLTAYKEMNL